MPNKKGKIKQLMQSIYSENSRFQKKKENTLLKTAAKAISVLDRILSPSCIETVMFKYQTTIGSC